MKQLTAAALGIYLSFQSLTTAAQIPCFDFEPVFSFTRNFTPPYRNAYAMEYAHDGNILISGAFALDPSMPWHFWTAKFSTDGDLIWENTEADPWGILARAFRVREDVDGNVIAVGATLVDPLLAADTAQIILAKYTAHGQLLWAKEFGLPNNREDAYDVAVCPDGGYIICGREWDIGFSDDFVVLIKTDKDGQTEWYKRYGSSPVETGYRVLALDNGNYVVGGHTWSLYDPQDNIHHGGMLLMIDHSGQIIWQEKEPNDRDGIFYDLLLNEDGSFWALGSTGVFAPGEQDVWLVRYSLSGQLLEEFTYGGSGTDDGWRLIRNPAGGLFILAFTDSDNQDICGNFGDLDAWLIKTDDQGSITWQGNIGGANYDGFTAGLPYQDGVIVSGIFSAPLLPDTVGHALVRITNLRTINSIQIDTTLCVGAAYTYTPSIPCANVIWNNQPDAASLEVKQQGVYTATLKNGDCKANLTYSVHFDPCQEEPCVIMPNAFTPNADGTNDTFQPIIQCGDIDAFQFKVYDRWGAVVYNSVSPENAAWNGECNDAPCSSEVYTWVLLYHIRTDYYEKKELRSGEVTLVR